MASQCWMAGRIEAAVGYSDAGQTVIGSGRDEVPFGVEGLLGGAYLSIGQPERCVEWCRAQLARGRDTDPSPGHVWSSALTVAGCGDEAMAAANGLIEAAEATRNPCVLSFALFAYGFAFRDADPVRALDALRRGLVIAQDSGNRCQRVTPGDHSGPTRGRTRRPAGRARLRHSGDPQLPRLGQHRRSSMPPWRSSPPCSTGSDATNRRPPSPVSRSVPSPRRASLKSTPRSPTCAMSSATRPTNRSPARVRR